MAQMILLRRVKFMRGWERLITKRKICP